jgi:hypothetical protein
VAVAVVVVVNAQKRWNGDPNAGKMALYDAQLIYKPFFE